jgi:hypothetical protein
MVFGANTYRAFARMLASSSEESEVRDPWVTRMRSLPATVVSTTLEGPLDWPNATLVSGDAVDVVAERAWDTRGGRAYGAKSRLATCSSTLARLRAPWSAAMKWLPIATEKAIRHRASSSSSSAQKGASSERR